jgi:hypothetical protein
MKAPALWEATLRLCPGAPVGRNLASGRQDLVPALAPGRPVAAWPALVGALYSLCGHSHRLCAELAIAAAMGEEGAEAGAWTMASPGGMKCIARALGQETLREHLRRILLDWPRLCATGADALPGGLEADLRTCPWPTVEGPDAPARLRGWLEDRLLGMPAAQWRAAWQAEGAGWLAAWSRSTPGWLPALVSRLQAHDSALALPAGRALPADGPRLAAGMAADPPDPMQPLWQGRPAHTGPWSRHHLAASPTPAGAWAVLGVRLAEFVTLCLPGDPGEPGEPGRSGAGWLCCGGQSLGPGLGLGWVEMARGLLMHVVRLDTLPGPDGRPRLADACVIAPTEWNFHAAGVAAEALARLPTDAPDGTLGLLMAALDPCVPWTRVPPGELTAATPAARAARRAEERAHA